MLNPPEKVLDVLKPLGMILDVLDPPGMILDVMIKGRVFYFLCHLLGSLLIILCQIVEVLRCPSFFGSLFVCLLLLLLLVFFFFFFFFKLFMTKLYVV